jgi:hypothetical protein
MIPDHSEAALSAHRRPLMTSIESLTRAQTCVRILAKAASIAASGMAGHTQLGARNQTMSPGDGNDQAVFGNDTVTVSFGRELVEQNRAQGNFMRMGGTTKSINVGIRGSGGGKLSLH